MGNCENSCVLQVLSRIQPLIQGIGDPNNSHYFDNLVQRTTVGLHYPIQHQAAGIRFILVHSTHAQAMDPEIHWLPPPNKKTTNLVRER